MTEKERWQEMIDDGVCPVCGGDCASANPPVIFCPMQPKVADTNDELHQILGAALNAARKGTSLGMSLNTAISIRKGHPEEHIAGVTSGPLRKVHVYQQEKS